MPRFPNWPPPKPVTLPPNPWLLPPPPTPPPPPRAPSPADASQRSEAADPGELRKGHTCHDPLIGQSTVIGRRAERCKPFRLDGRTRHIQWRVQVHLERDRPA